MDVKDFIPVLRQKYDKYTSLQPQENDLEDTAIETAAGFTPGLAQAMAVRDVARAWNDPAGRDYLGMGLAATGLVNAGPLVKALRGAKSNIIKDVYHGTPLDIPVGDLKPGKPSAGFGKLGKEDKGLWFSTKEDVAKAHANATGEGGFVHKGDLAWPDPAREAADPLGVHHFQLPVDNKLTKLPPGSQTGHYSPTGSADYGPGDNPIMSIMDPKLFQNESKYVRLPPERAKKTGSGFDMVDVDGNIVNSNDWTPAHEAAFYKKRK